MEGCSLGVAFTKTSDFILFKNRDLTEFGLLPEPKTSKGKTYRYIGFGRSGNQPGIWMGINEEGLGILGADAYTISRFKIDGCSSGIKTFEAYEEVMGSAGNLSEARRILSEFYFDNRIGDPDIILAVEPNSAMILEYIPWCAGSRFEPTFAFKLVENRPYTVKTNFFEILTEHRLPREYDVSSHVRYERTAEMLSAKAWRTTLDDIKEICRDHANGPSANSICRHGGDGEFSTLSSVIAQFSQKSITVHYVINNAPCKVPEYRQIQLV